MKFTINLARDDYVRFNKYALAKINKNKRLKNCTGLTGFLYLICLSIFVLEIYWIYDKDWCQSYGNLNSALVALGAFFILANTLPMLYKHLLLSESVAVVGTVLGTWEIELSGFELSESNDRCSSTYKWECVQSIEKDKDNLYVFVDVLKVIILPLDQITAEIEAEINRRVVRV